MAFLPALFENLHGDSDLVVVSNLADAGLNALTFDATSRDRLVSPNTPLTVTVTDPNDGTTKTFGAGPTFGIGVRTAAVIGLPGITTAPEEIGYYPQITTPDKADVLTIKFNQDFDTSGEDSGFVFSYFYSREGSASGEVLRYQLLNDGAPALLSNDEPVGEKVVTAVNTGIFDFRNAPNAQNSGTFHYQFSTDISEPVVFDEVIITAGNGLSTDGTDALLEAIIANAAEPTDPDEEDPEAIPGLIDFKPTSNPSAFNVNGGGVVPAAVIGSDTLVAADVDPASIRLAFDFDELIAGNGIAAMTDLDKIKLQDVNSDGITDLQVFFTKEALMTIVGQIPTGADLNDLDLFMSFKLFDSNTVYFGQNPENDPVKLAGNSFRGM